MPDLPLHNNLSAANQYPDYHFDPPVAYPTPASTQDVPRAQRPRGPPPDFNISLSNLADNAVPAPPRPTIRDISPDTNYGDDPFQYLIRSNPSSHTAESRPSSRASHQPTPVRRAPTYLPNGTIPPDQYGVEQSPIRAVIQRSGTDRDRAAWGIAPLPPRMSGHGPSTPMHGPPALTHPSHYNTAHGHYSSPHRQCMLPYGAPNPNTRPAPHQPVPTARPLPAPRQPPLPPSQRPLPPSQPPAPTPPPPSQGPAPARGRKEKEKRNATQIRAALAHSGAAAAATSSTAAVSGRANGSTNYSNENLLTLCKLVARDLPQGGDDWRAVAEEYNEITQETRKMEDLRKKWERLVTSKPPTGEPEMPEHIRLAKEADLKIRSGVRCSPVDDTGADVYMESEPAASFDTARPTASAPTPSPSMPTASSQATLEKSFTASREGSNNRRGRAGAASTGLQRDQRAPSTTLLNTMIADMSPEAQAARTRERNERASNMLNMSFFQQQLTAQTQRADDLQRRLDESLRDHIRELARLQRKYDELKLERMMAEVGRRKHRRSRSYSSSSSASSSADEWSRKRRRTDDHDSRSRSSSSRHRKSRRPAYPPHPRPTSRSPKVETEEGHMHAGRTEEPEIIDVDAQDFPERDQGDGAGVKEEDKDDDEDLYA